MQRGKFKAGDRVVNTSLGSKYEGIGGTVVQVDWIPNRVTLSNLTKGLWQLVIILDTAERFIVTQTHMWEHEQDYLDGSYIPF